MHRETLIACAPYVAAIAVLLLAQGLILRFSRARLQLAALKTLHHDQRGAVQSLSFVLTLPVFLFLMLFIVQLSLITMARISVEYAAYAAARSAIVWFPSNLGYDMMEENRVSQSPLIPVRYYEANGRNYTVYLVPPDSEKYARVHLAAAMACMPICPSTNTGATSTSIGTRALPSILRAYEILAPSSLANARVPARLRNKLTYALANTYVEIEVHHCGDQIQGGDPPLYADGSLEIEHPSRYLWPNEIGWQDQVYVRVYHQYALLPAAGRLLSRYVSSPDYIVDNVAPQIRGSGGLYTRTLVATARMGNEGQIPTGTIQTFGNQRPTTYVQPLPWNP